MREVCVAGIFTIIGAILGGIIQAKMQSNEIRLVSETGQELIVTAEEYKELFNECLNLKEELNNYRLSYEEKEKEINRLEKEKENLPNNSEDENSASERVEFTTKLSDLFVIDSIKYTVEDSIKDSYGNPHDLAHKFDASLDAYAIYNLNGEYTLFSCKVVTSPNTGRDAKMKITFIADGVIELGTIEDIVKLDEVQESGNIDITGYKTLTIKTSNYGAFNYGFCYLVDAVLK